MHDALIAGSAVVSVGVADHLNRLQAVYDDRFAREYGTWRPVVGEVADKFLACGLLEHDFARVRCDACAHEYLLAFAAADTVTSTIRALTGERYLAIGIVACLQAHGSRDPYRNSCRLDVSMKKSLCNFLS